MVGRYALMVVLLALMGAGNGAVVGAGRADEAPPIAPFKTARVSIAGTVSAQGQEIPVQGAGDIDATRRASQLTIGLLGTTFETIVVDGRSYSRNPASGRWQYTEGAQGGGFNPARLAPYEPETIRAAGRNFARLGPETVEGAATSHWRADADYARLLGLAGGSGTLGGSGLDAQTATMDLWIGDADGYLHRLRVDARGTTTDATGATAPFAQALTLTFSNFDAPVQIVAPPDAVPAPTPGPPGSPVAVASPAARGTAVAAAVAPTAAAGPASAGIEGVEPAYIAGGVLALLGLIALALAFAWRRLRAEASRGPS